MGNVQTPAVPRGKNIGDGEHLAVLGYQDTFERSMSLWANFALGFTYLSPLVGVYSLFAIAMSSGGPPSVFWILIVGAGQFLVALVFGEVVSQYPIHGGIYPWTRRLWGRRYAWMSAWIYIWAMIVTITSVAQFGSGFLASLFNFELTRGGHVVAFRHSAGCGACPELHRNENPEPGSPDRSGRRTGGCHRRGAVPADLPAQAGIRHLLQLHGSPGDQPYAAAFMGAALAGLFLFYGFEACGDVAEEVSDAARRIPRAMMMTILVGGVSALFSFCGYVLAAPNLQEIVNGDDADPIPAILEVTLGPSAPSSSWSSRSPRSCPAS